MLYKGAACVDYQKKTSHSTDENFVRYRSNFLSLDFEYLINEYDGCGRP